MRKQFVAALVFTLGLAAAASADTEDGGTFGPAAKNYVRYDAPAIAIRHVRVIHGTGALTRENQTVLIDSGKVAAVDSDGKVLVPCRATVIDGSGRTLMPGLVGMHDHLFYFVGDNPPVGHAMYVSFPRLYLAGGVTTIRTTGSMEPYADLNLKRAIDEGRLPGPNIDVSGPYISGPGSRLYHVIPRTPQEVTQAVNYYADVGVTSFKAYAFVTKTSLAALITAAHKRGIKVAVISVR